MLADAREHQRLGRAAEAVAICRRVLDTDPDRVEALHLLGVAALATQDFDSAIDLFSRVLQAVATNPFCHVNLGDALAGAGRRQEAQAHYRNALEVKSADPDQYMHLGNAFAERALHDYACAAFRRAIELRPLYAEAHFNLGNSFRSLGRQDDAAASYTRAIEIRPGYAEAHNHLGMCLKDSARPVEAVASYVNALAVKPEYPEAHNNLGNALSELGRVDEALASYRRALELDPGYARAHNNLALLLGEQCNSHAAIAGFRRALEIDPEFAEAHYNLGVALGEQGRPDEEVASYRRALSIRPDYAEAYTNLLFVHSYSLTTSPADYLPLARGWESACISPEDRRAARGRTFSREPLSGRRLRIGYMSGDFRQHAMMYFIEQLLARHDRTRVELFAFSTNRACDTVTQRLQALVDHWIPVATASDATLRDRIDAEGIDVLIDLSGHTAHNRLGAFARRAAPVQAHYLGYFASTGLTEMDYWIGDEVLAPPEADSHFAEEIWRLPRAWVSYRTIAAAPESGWRPAPDGSVCVGSFNGLGKLTPQTLALWARVLHALPEGRLLLKNKGLGSADSRGRILQALADHGIAADRVELEPASEWVDYMASHDRLDIALDPVGGRGGGTSTCDALWMGCPVIHALGDRATSRFTASMLTAIGRPEWIAHSEAEYIEKVVALARDVDRRRALRFEQRALMCRSPLCDADDLARHLESAYFEMFERWRKRQFLRS